MNKIEGNGKYKNDKNMKRVFGELIPNHMLKEGEIA